MCFIYVWTIMEDNNNMEMVKKKAYKKGANNISSLFKWYA